MPQVGKFQLRVGLVLYGGSSLAVYMSGMTQELLAVVRASQARKVLAHRERNAGELLAWAEREKAANAYYDLLEQADVDVVIDVISGTSAGGLNGLLLAKALAAGTPELGSITDSLWRDKADMEILARYDKSPRSVLSGDFLYAELNRLLQQIQNDGRQDLAGMVKVLDLFVTATDVRGHSWTRWDRFNQKLQGHSHKYLFRLMKRQPQGQLRGYYRNDFIADSPERQEKVDDLLAKIGRATSAFPGVFPPIFISPADAKAAGVDVLGDVAPACKDGIWFSDGGILVNAPFDPVLDTIIERGANQPVRRVLAYLQPDPTEQPPAAQTEPGMVETALSALTLPMEQDILDKLDRLREENQRRTRLMQMLQGLDGVIDSGGAEGAASDLGALIQMSLAMNQAAATAAPIRPETAGAPVPAPIQVGTYYQIRLNRLNQVLKDAFTRALERFGLKEAALQTAVARLLGKLSPGDAVTGENLEAVRAYLDRFDVEYQSRRYHYLLNRIHDHCRPGVTFQNPADLEAMLNDLWGALEDWNNSLWVLAHAGHLPPQPDRWQDVCEAVNRSVAAYAAAASDETALDGAVQELCAYMDAVQTACAELSSAAFARAEAALAAERSADLRPQLDIVALQRAFRDFAALDMVLFPVTIGTGRNDWSPIGLYRFTPDAARGWIKKRLDEKLAGETLGHFGAFLDSRWRSNDIMWGRLDAAEEIVRMVAQEANLIADGAPFTPALNRTAMARRRRILSAYPDLIDLEQLRSMTLGVAPAPAPAMQPMPAGQRMQAAWQVLTQGQAAAALQSGAAAPAFSLDQVPDDVLREYLTKCYKVGEEGIDSLPPKKLAGELLMMLDNTAQALGKPTPSPFVGKLQQALVGVLKPLDWVARLALLPQKGLAGQIQQNLAPLMTLVGAVLLVAGATGAVTLSRGGIILVVALFTPVLLDVFFRPTGLKVLLLGLPTALTCLAAGAPALLKAGWLQWLAPLLTWLAQYPSLGQLWVPFLCVFVGSVLTWWSGARWRRRMHSIKEGAGA